MFKPRLAQQTALTRPRCQVFQPEILFKKPEPVEPVTILWAANSQTRRVISLILSAQGKKPKYSKSSLAASEQMEAGAAADALLLP